MMLCTLRSGTAHGGDRHLGDTDGAFGPTHRWVEAQASTVGTPDRML
jgi:hypothetical protein